MGVAEVLPERRGKFQKSLFPRELGDRLHIRHRRAFRLFEMRFRTGHESAEAEIGDGENHVEIFVHVAVVQQMVAIQAAEPPRFFHAAVEVDWLARRLVAAW